ncbi:hypothetical protein ACHAXA_005122 [Cyclostephanos tholiformis]|uniref:Uncharacterized protein n=1 Tax=Cyclostephanos tholiformis TaxID=382380 RepID=A0ABD3RX98_9STRA
MKRSIASIYLLAIVVHAFPIATLSFSPNAAAVAGGGGRRRLDDDRGVDDDAARRRHRRPFPRATSRRMTSETDDVDDERIIRPARRRVDASAAAAAAVLAILLSTSAMTSTVGGGAGTGMAAYAYDTSSSSDRASETVSMVISRLEREAGNVDGTYGVLEEISKIITEGKGVGGTLTYDGVKLGDGIAIADEDTTIYNPGLTLLTYAEKQRLVTAIVDNRRIGLSMSSSSSSSSSSPGGWSANNEQAFAYLKSLLDPLHMHELTGYLGILPYYGALLYLVALYVQKNAREIFPLAYGLCALGVFGPVLVLVASGP